MMTDTTIRELVLDTLFAKRVGPPGTSVRTNQAGIELAQSSVEAVPIIERVIASEVLPVFASQLSQAPNTLIASIDYSSMIGLNYVFGAYLVINVRNNRSGMIDYLCSLPPQLQYEAVNCASTFFYKTSDGFNFGVAPSKLLAQFVQRVESSPVPEVSDAAKKIRGQLDSYAHR